MGDWEGSEGLRFLSFKGGATIIFLWGCEQHSSRWNYNYIESILSDLLISKWLARI